MLANRLSKLMRAITLGISWMSFTSWPARSPCLAGPTQEPP
jgi:hypothetical protein